MSQNVMTFLERNSAIIKMAVIAVLSILLLIPVVMISSLVMERKVRQNEALEEVSSKWGLEQQIAGPILTVPYTTFDLNRENERINVSKKSVCFLPSKLEMDATIVPEIRYRGLFKVPVYRSDLDIRGYFDPPVIASNNPNIEIDWEGASVTMGLSDMRGIAEPVVFGWNGAILTCEPGVSVDNILKSGITVNKVINGPAPELKYEFDINLALNGSKRLSLTPLGKETSAKVTSTWKNPSFDGAFLPTERNISDQGFSASWKVLELNRNYPQTWIDKKYDIDGSAFGVSLMFPVDNYLLTERSMKYAILFIALTFMTFFFIEIIHKKRVHPVQYILIGFGLILFYLLLLSLSEHIGFNFSYLAASLGIIVMVTGYSSSILKSRKLLLLMTFVLVILYGFLFILLQMEELTLLIGSIALFIILSLVMYLSRKIDWYNLSGKVTENHYQLPDQHHFIE